MITRPMRDDILVKQIENDDVAHDDASRIKLLTTHGQIRQGLVLAIGPDVYGIEVGDTVVIDGGSMGGGVEAPGGRLVSMSICFGVVV